jgi:hypothetical protein
MGAIMVLQSLRHNVSILSTVLFVVGWTSCSQNHDQAARIKASVEQTIPLGADQARVAAVLDSLRIEHSGYDQAKHQILAIARNVSRTSTTTTALQITLQFDSAGKLRGRDFTPVYTGP